MPSPTISIAWFLRVVLPGFIVATGGWLYLSLFWGITLAGADAVSLAMYAFAGTLIGFTIDAYDPLLHGKWPSCEEKAFFGSQLPSGYVRSRCENCEQQCIYKADSSTMSNHCISAWFYIFDNLFPDYLRGYVLDLSSACRAVVYLKYVALALWCAGTVTLAVTVAGRWLLLAGTAVFSGVNAQGWFVVASGLVYLTIGRLHRPRTDSPRGVWHKWQNVCRDQIFWLHVNSAAVTEVLCKQQES